MGRSGCLVLLQGPGSIAGRCSTGCSSRFTISSPRKVALNLPPRKGSPAFASACSSRPRFRSLMRSGEAGKSDSFEFIIASRDTEHGRWMPELARWIRKPLSGYQQEDRAQLDQLVAILELDGFGPKQGDV